MDNTVQDYRYNETDDGLALWGRNFTSRIGDGDGDHEQAYLDTLDLVFELKRGGSLIEIGSGFGRIVGMAVPKMSFVVGLEPDYDRYRYCHDSYHDPPRCQILRSMSGDYIRVHPDARFDVVVISMVLQHVATDVCRQLLADAHTLVKSDGVVVIATTHGPASAIRYTTSGAGPDDAPLSREAFDAYAKAIADQDRGIPVRRFTRDELIDLVSSDFEVLHWEQFSYIRPDKLGYFAARLGVSAGELTDVGDSQFLILRAREVAHPVTDSAEISTTADSAQPEPVSEGTAPVEEMDIEPVEDPLRIGYVDKGTQTLLGIKFRELVSRGEIPDFRDVEFSNYSQTGEDGILNFIFSVLGTTNRTLVEMCAGNGVECNSANLLINHGWNGVLFDGDPENIAKARGFFRYHRNTWFLPPRVVHAWITAENVNDLLRENGISGEIDFFSLDMDGVDYWVWKALTEISPRVVMLEIHAPWKCDVSVTVPYRPDFKTEWVQLPQGPLIQYAGASLPAFMKLAAEKGYRLVGGNRMGFNVIFVRNNVGADLLPAVEPESIFRDPVMNAAYALVRPGIEDLEWESV